jgi:hypothetical protein
MNEWGGKRAGAGRRRRKEKTARLRATVLESTLAKIQKSSFDLGITFGEVVDKKFPPSVTLKKKLNT